MKRILKTDKAYTAIDKINDNFDEVYGDESFDGSVTGDGNNWVYYDFSASAGDYYRIQFPNGTWTTASSREGYNKLMLTYLKSDGTTLYSAEIVREPWPIQDYGYDFIVSSYGTSTLEVTKVRVYIRATSGVTVPFTITKLSTEHVKSYFEPEVRNVVYSVRTFQTSPCFNFALCSDLHYLDLEEGYRPFAPYSPLGMFVNMKEVARHIRLDNVICLGDMIDGRWSAAVAMRHADEQMTFMKNVGVPIIYAIGNHDDNRYWSQQGGDRRLTSGEMHSYFIQPVDERAGVDGTMNGCNYYRDIDRFKIRLIVILGITFTGSYGFTSDTTTWFSDVMDSIPAGYKAIIFTHEPVRTDWNWANTSAISGASTISSTIVSNIDKVIGFFFGHTHIDNVYLDPFVAVNIGCQKVYNNSDGTNPPGSSAPEDCWWPVRAAGDARENLWDVVSIDQTNEVIACIRFGAGVDRYIHYTPIVVAAGGTVTLSPAYITADTWHVRDSESSSISISSGVVTVSSGATPGSRLTARAADADGNFEYWAIKVS